MAEPPQKKKKKRTETTGYSSKTNADRTARMQRQKTKGDWRRFGTINVKVVTAYVKWQKLVTPEQGAGSSEEELDDVDTDNIKTFITEIPVGMKNVLTKMESQQNRALNQLPLAIKEHFLLKESNYKPENFKVTVSFSTDSKYSDFTYAYCHLCSNKKQLQREHWDKHSEELPSEVSLSALMENWDKLNLSWNQQEVLGCLLPNEEHHSMIVNAKMMLRPEKHWNSVHEKKQKNPNKVQRSLVPMDESNADVVCLSDKTNQPSTSKSKNTATMKLNYSSKKTKQSTVTGHFDPKFNFVGSEPKSRLETYTFGRALKNIHVGINCNISDQTILKYQNNGLEDLREYYNEFVKDKTSDLPLPPRVTVNGHNINNGIHAIVEAYRKLDKSEDNPYRLLEKADHFSLIHDATTYFVKQVNSTMIRLVKGDGSIVKVPWNLKRVSGSLTGEVLCEELMEEISYVRAVPNNAAEKIGQWISGAPAKADVAELQERLKEATSALDVPLISSLSKELESAVSEAGNAAALNAELPPAPHYFRIATVKGVEEESKTVHLVIQSDAYPASVCGDSCYTNLKGQRLADELYGLLNSFSNCTSHIASRSLARTATSQTMSDENVKALYNNLIKVLGHFKQSPKSTEMLNRALTILEMNNVHMLVWGSTRMSGFLDGCAQCSSLLVPFMDTLVTGNIRPDETKYLLSPKGIFLLQLMADIHPVFANKYLHKTDSDTVISCQTKGIATKTCERLRDLDAVKAMEVYNTMYEDDNQNIHVKITDAINKTASHDITLNTKVTRQVNLESHKTGLLQMKDDVIDCLVRNIEDQVENANLMTKLSCLDLESTDSFDTRKENMRALYQLFGNDIEHQMPEWNEYNIMVTYKRRLTCTEEALISDFDKATPLINDMGRRLKNSKSSLEPLTQLELWQEFLQKHYLQYPSFGDLVRIMLVIPPNSGWVERAYSILEQICQKRRNALKVEHMRDMLLLSVLRLSPKKCMDYKDEIQILSGMSVI